MGHVHLQDDAAEWSVMKPNVFACVMDFFASNQVVKFSARHSASYFGSFGTIKVWFIISAFFVILGSYACFVLVDDVLSTNPNISIKNRKNSPVSSFNRIVKSLNIVNSGHNLTTIARINQTNGVTQTQRSFGDRRPRHQQPADRFAFLAPRAALDTELDESGLAGFDFLVANGVSCCFLWFLFLIF